MVKGISTMAYYNSIYTIIYFPAYRFGQGYILFRTHILAKYPKKFFCFQIAYVSQLRNSSIQLAR